MDKSGNGTYINDRLIGKNNKDYAMHGDIIWILHRGKVNVEDVIGYKLILS